MVRHGARVLLQGLPLACLSRAGACARETPARKSDSRNHNTHSARVEHTFKNNLTTSNLILRIHATHGTPAAVFRVRVFA